MSTLKTHNLQSPDAGSVNIALAPNAGMVVAGLSTYSNQINVGSNIKIGTAGVVTATSFVGSGAQLTGITGTTINNNANNRLITGSGTANTLEGESQLTYDGVSFKNIFSATGYTPITAEFRNTASVWGGGVRFKSSNTYGSIEIMRYDGNYGAGLYNSTGGWHWDGNLQFHGSVTPWTDGNLNLGSSSKRWANLYINDLQLSNKGSTNSVDNTWGDYTIQEGESDLFLINNRNGKKYKFNLTEVS